jgi:imidazolonepropionase-like amidohydrolase
VACTAHAGIAVRQSLEAGCDSLELVADIDAETIRMVVEKGTYMTFGLLRNKTNGEHQKFPMAEMSKASFQRALKAGVKILFAANAGQIVRNELKGAVANLTCDSHYLI